jgi:hypothetical protein
VGVRRHALPSLTRLQVQRMAICFSFMEQVSASADSIKKRKVQVHMYFLLALYFKVH